MLKGLPATVEDTEVGVEFYKVCFSVKFFYMYIDSRKSVLSKAC